MLKRTLTGTVIVAVVYCAVFFSENISWLLTLGTALLTAAAIYELFHAANIRNKGIILLSASVAVAVVISPLPGYLSILGVVFSAAMIIFGVWMTRLKPGNGKQWWIFPTSAAVTLLFKAIPELNQRELIAAITVCFLTDVSGRKSVWKALSCQSCQPSQNTGGFCCRFDCSCWLCLDLRCSFV